MDAVLGLTPMKLLRIRFVYGVEGAAKARSHTRTLSRPWRDAGSWRPAYCPWSISAMMNWNKHGVRAPGSPCLAAEDARI